MRILITGHKGFVGRHFYSELKKLGHDVLGIDVSDGISCEKFFLENDEVFDYVFHFACYVDPETSVKNLKKSNFAYDLTLDSCLFSWLIKTKQKNIIYFSSSSVYPIELQKDKNYKLKESDVDNNFNIIKKPDNIYGWTKLTGEYMLNYVRDNGIRTYIFRPFSIYGEDQNSSFIFKNFLDAAFRKDKEVSVWGDGHQTRDFIHIDDVVGAVLTIVFNGHHSPINIGTGVATSINDLLKIIMAKSGWNPKINYILDKDIGQTYRCSDISELKKIYNNKNSLSEVVGRYFGNKHED